MSNNPWEDLAKPTAVDLINARRVDPTLAYHFFWARALDGSYMLVLKHNTASTPVEKLPRLKGIELAVWNTGESEPMLVLKLLDHQQRDIFYRLCSDVIDAAGSAPSELEAVRRTVARTWRWHHLLRGGQDSCLTAEEQKGLIGELLVLERLLLPNMLPLDAVLTWRGPLGSPKDFEINTICIEAKARRGAATPYVSISSEFQLDTGSLDALFLYVIDLSTADSEHAGAATLTQIARRLREQLELRDPAALDHFDSMLAAAGFRWQDNYEAYRWIEGVGRIFLVDEDFPRLGSSGVPAGVSRVRYSLSLDVCEPFETSVNQLLDAMEAGKHVQ